MEKKYLTDLGIADDVADKIVAQAATEVTTATKDLEATKETLKTTAKQLADANKQIGEFKDLDLEGIKKAADDYKAKYEAAEAGKAAYIHKAKIDGYVKGLKLKDDIYESHVAQQLIDKGLKFDDAGKLIGGDDIVSSFRESHPDAFKADGPQPKFDTSIHQQNGGGAEGVTAAFLARNPGMTAADIK